jgi:hypothetical protein
MAHLLKNLLLITSCFPLVFGCCWQMDSLGLGAYDASPQHGFRVDEVVFPLGQTASEDGPHDRETEHCCLTGIAATSHCLADRTSCGVQISHRFAAVPCSLMTHTTACDTPRSSWVNSLWLHLAKQVLLI